MAFAWFSSCGRVMRQMEIEAWTSPNSLELKLHSDRAPNSSRPPDLCIILITTDPWESFAPQNHLHHSPCLHHSFHHSFPVLYLLHHCSPNPQLEGSPELDGHLLQPLVERQEIVKHFTTITTVSFPFSLPPPDQPGSWLQRDCAASHLPCISQRHRVPMFFLNNWRGLNAKTVRLPSRSPWHGDNNKKRQPPHWFGVLLHNQLQGALAPAHATHEFGNTSTLGPSPVSPSQAEAAISSSTAGLSRTEWEHDRQGMNLQACLSRNSLMQLKSAIPSSYLE